ncbi:MAG: class I SAM-dependent methyltransferase [Bacteroidota bacterium]
MKLYLNTKDYAFSQEEFKLFLDEARDMLITQPCPANLGKYYESDTYISHTDGKNSLLEIVYQRVKRITLKRKVDLVTHYAGDGKVLLDVGAGTGDFLNAAQKTGWSIMGTEPNAKARTLAGTKGIRLYKGWDDLPEQKFDSITLWHVLEHLPHLEWDLEQLLARLKGDGSLVIAVPNFRSYDAGYYGKYWAAYDVPRHVWHFSRDAIEKLFHERGMQVIETKPMLFDSFYVSMLSEKYRNGKGNLLRAFMVGLWSNIKAWGSGEYSSVIYILQRN